MIATVIGSNLDSIPLVGAASEEATSTEAVSSGDNELARPAVRIGFVELIDSAPVIVAHTLGYFRDAGLDVVLSREIGWANVRDKLAYQRLDAAATLIGMPLRAAIEPTYTGEPLRAVMSLGTGGDAVTLCDRVVRAGVTSGTHFADYLRQSRNAEPLRLAHVFESSVHHYLLRDWLAEAGLDPDRDIRLCVLPPAQMAAHLASGNIAGCCVGEPWNSVAQHAGSGRIVALTSDLMPAHPDKVLAVNEQWARQNAPTVVALVRAMLRASRFCADAKNAGVLVDLLSRPEYLGVPRDAVLRSLSLGNNPYRGERPAGWQMRSFGATFPSQTHAAWLVTQMQRWGHASADVDPWAVAARVTDSSAYRIAAESLGIACPDTDAPPLSLRNKPSFSRPAAAGRAVTSLQGASA